MKSSELERACLAECYLTSWIFEWVGQSVNCRNVCAVPKIRPMVDVMCGDVRRLDPFRYHQSSGTGSECGIVLAH
jgi:hypothetical protein